jgi:outer membrane protein assembly factor BamB
MTIPKILLAGLLVLAAHAGVKEATPAVMYRRNASHDARYETAPITTLTGVNWKVTLDGNVFSSPVVCNDTVYIGSGNNRFYALKAATGETVWSVATSGAVHSSPAISDGLVCFGDCHGTFYALDAASGKERWTFHVEGERRFGAKGLHGATPRDKYFVDDWDFFLSSPVVGGGLVYFGSGNGRVYALDLRTGAERWSFPTGEVVHCSPALADGNLYFGGWDGIFHCVDAATGVGKWQVQTGLDPVNHNQVGFQSAPVVCGNVVYFGCRDSNVYALDALDGKIVWRKNNRGSWVVVSPVIRQDELYYTTSDTARFIALDRRTGTELYSLPIQAWGFSSPVAAGDLVYFGVLNGDLVAVDTATKSVKWEFQTEEARRDARGVLKADGALDVAKIFATDKEGNTPDAMRLLFSTGAILSTPAPWRETLIFGTADGHVYSIH